MLVRNSAGRISLRFAIVHSILSVQTLTVSVTISHFFSTPKCKSFVPFSNSDSTVVVIEADYMNWLARLIGLTNYF